MNPLYQVTDWDNHFENNRTRGLTNTHWVPVPNKMDGDGYTELVDHENGAAHLGAWIAIIQIASKCDPRGTLMRDGDRPHDARSLARLSRLKSEVFDEVLPRLVTIGWLSVQVEQNQPVVIIAQASAVEAQADAPRDARVEQNRIEQKEDGLPAQKRRQPSTIPDDKFLDHLQAKEAYRNLNVRAVNSKMQTWCEMKGKQGTRMRLINWLNREDQPVGRGNAADPVKDCQTCGGNRVYRNPAGALVKCNHDRLNVTAA